jgi:hypothetical protein
VQAGGEILRPPPALRVVGQRPGENTARSRAATAKTWNRGPHSWTSDGSSHVAGPVPATRAWIDRSAARGMLSCSPAQAACRSEHLPAGSRSSRAPACRRNARICVLARSSREPSTICHSSRPGPALSATAADCPQSCERSGMKDPAPDIVDLPLERRCDGPRSATLGRGLREGRLRGGEPCQHIQHIRHVRAVAIARGRAS